MNVSVTRCRLASTVCVLSELTLLAGWILVRVVMTPAGAERWRHVNATGRRHQVLPRLARVYADEYLAALLLGMVVAWPAATRRVWARTVALASQRAQSIGFTFQPGFGAVRRVVVKIEPLARARFTEESIFGPLNKSLPKLAPLPTISCLLLVFEKSGAGAVELNCSLKMISRRRPLLVASLQQRRSADPPAC